MLYDAWIRYQASLQRLFCGKLTLRIAQNLNLHHCEQKAYGGQSATANSVQIEVARRVWAQLVIQGEQTTNQASGQR